MGRPSKLRDSILNLKEQGKRYKEISQILNCSSGIITYHCKTTFGDGRKNKPKILKTYSKAKEMRDKYNKRNKNYVVEYLISHPCIDCGNTDIRVLDFDHVRDVKINNIATACQKAWKLEKLIAEIKKCEVRCANCHRIVTYERRIKKPINITTWQK